MNLFGKLFARKAAVARLDEAMRSLKAHRPEEAKVELDLRHDEPKLALIKTETREMGDGMVMHRHDGLPWHWAPVGHRGESRGEG